MSKYQEQYDRTKRWYDRLTAIDQGRAHDMASDHYVDEIYAFFLNCYHLKDWIKNDGNVRWLCQLDLAHFDGLIWPPVPFNISCKGSAPWFWFSLVLLSIYLAVGAVGTVGNSTVLVEFSKRWGNGGKTQFVFPPFP